MASWPGCAPRWRSSSGAERPRGARVVARPSGTEPKLKAYLEVVVDAAGDVPAAREQARGELAELRAAVEELIGS